MKLFFVYSLIFFLVAPAYTALAEANTATGNIHHVVVFWLKKPADPDARASLIDTTMSFRKFPGVLSVSAGLPLASERAVVDDSFDVAITITFEDETALKAYQINPLHVKAREEILKSLIDKFIVYNFVD